MLIKVLTQDLKSFKSQNYSLLTQGYIYGILFAKSEKPKVVKVVQIEYYSES